MDIKVETPASPKKADQKTPLLAKKASSSSASTPSNNLDYDNSKSSRINRALSSTFQGTAYLASRLPTGLVLTFQLLAPILSNQGVCDTATRAMTAVFLAICGVSCCILSFTDRYVDKKGNSFYGFATFKGFYVIDRGVTIPPEEAQKKKISPFDFLQAFLSMLVFATIALLDQNIVDCFYPTPSVEMKEILSALPVVNGVVCSMLIVVFPTQRHGMGFANSPSS